MEGFVGLAGGCDRGCGVCGGVPQGEGREEEAADHAEAQHQAGDHSHAAQVTCSPGFLCMSLENGRLTGAASLHNTEHALCEWRSRAERAFAATALRRLKVPRLDNNLLPACCIAAAPQRLTLFCDSARKSSIQCRKNSSNTEPEGWEECLYGYRGSKLKKDMTFRCCMGKKWVL